MFAFETLCRCGHLTSDHVTIGSWTPGQLPEFGETPCVRCNEAADDLPPPYCTGFEEWPFGEMPDPAALNARLLGCTCPRFENLTAVKDRTPPVYADDCPLHIWICKRIDICDHSTAEMENTIDHRKPHYACEHCTVPNIECSTCGKVWVDWRVGPETAGWRHDLLTGAAGALMFRAGDVELAVKSATWRCGTCSTNEAPMNATNATN